MNEDSAIARKYKATKENKRKQYVAFYNTLEKRPSGRFTSEASYRLEQWLHMEGITRTWFHQVVKGYQNTKPENIEYTKQCIEYLERYGYKVVKEK